MSDRLSEDQAISDAHEARRLAALDRYDILDTPPEQGFDDITRLAAQFCSAPIGLITFVDDARQFFKARVGFEGEANSPLDIGFCPIVVRRGRPVIIPDTAADPAYADNLAVRKGGVRFYAGVPLLTADKQTLGTLCVLDTKPRPEGLTPQQRQALEVLSREVMTLLELRRETEERKQSEARLTGAIEIARLGTFDWNATAGTVVLDARGREIFGLPATGAVRQDDVFARIDPAEFEQAFAAASAGFETGSRVEIDYNVIWPDGTMRMVRSVGDPVIEGNGTRRMFGVFRDITEEKRAEAVLRASNVALERQVQARTREFERAWRLSQELLVVALPDGTLETVNPLWTELLGWTAGELVGSNFVDYTHPDDLSGTLVAFAGILTKALTTPYEYRFRHKDGTYHWFAWTGAFEDGKVYASGRQVTIEREQAEALRQSQKLEAVGHLTGGVAHDFNNLLTVIKSSSDLLKRPDLPEARRARYVAAISDTVDRAAKLTGQLLAFARRQALKPEVFDACESVRSITDMMGTLTGSRIRIVRRLGTEPCYLNADPSQFDTALVNMAVNARDAMGGEGQLTVCVQAVEQMPAVRTHAVVKGTFVAVSVTDTGSGIPPQLLDRIFEPFFTTKGVGQGTGLGLSQVFGFAKQSGGEVTVTSELGKGTTFTLYLPRVAGESRKAAPADEPHVLTGGHGTCVLVVEDNADVGTFAFQTLTDLGYMPVLAANAEEALAELANDADRFDVVFTDVVMPGMNGIDLAHQIRSQHHDLPVVLTSGYSHVLAQNGTYGFELLHKPYSVEELSRILRKVATWQRRKRIISK